MISANSFIGQALERGFDFYTGVPCSFLTPLINGVISGTGLQYIGAASEGEAVAIAAGAWLGGRTTVVMCQNSGLGNAVNPLTSLNAPFRIPTLFITTWRGEPGLKDEPQHEVMGQITHDLLALIGSPPASFPSEPQLVAPAFAEARRAMDETGLPAAWVMRKGDVEDSPLDQAPFQPRPAGRRDRFEEAAIGRPAPPPWRPSWPPPTRRPPSSPPPARPAASSSPSMTASSICTRWAQWAGRPAWRWAWRSTRRARSWCWTATARRS